MKPFFVHQIKVSKVDSLHFIAYATVRVLKCSLIVRKK